MAAGIKNTLAFTLIEIMMVLIIISILTAAAVPGLQNFLRNQEVNILTAQLASSMRNAKSRAIKENTNVCICAISVSGASLQSQSHTCSGTQNIWNSWAAYMNGTINSANLIHMETTNATDSITTNNIEQICFTPLGFTTGLTTDKIFTIKPINTIGDNCRQLTLSKIGIITIDSINCA